MIFRGILRETICSAGWHSACAMPAPPMYTLSGWAAMNFVLIGTDLAQELSRQFVEHLRGQLSHYGLDAALGWTGGTADALENLQALLIESDRQMYSQKHRIHRHFSWVAGQSADQVRSV